MPRAAKCMICYKKCTEPSELLSFHSFPDDQEIKQKWIDFCISCGCLTKNDFVENLKICHSHFSQSAYEESASTGGNLQLKEGAFPSIYGGCPYKEPDHPDYDPALYMDVDNITNFTASTGQKYVQHAKRNSPKVKCCSSECNSMEPDAMFYKFPQSMLLINMWKSALQILRSQIVTNFSVCERHFDERDFLPGTKKLRKLAIPSIQRKDKKIHPNLYKQIGPCNCKCTCGNRQDNLKSANSAVLQNIPNSSKSKGVVLPINQSVHDQNNEEDHSPITSPKNDGLTNFEENEFKENTVVIIHKSTRVWINSDSSSLMGTIAQQVRKVLVENTSENMPVTVPDEVVLCEESVDKNLVTLTKSIEEIIVDRGSNFEMNNVEELEETTGVMAEEATLNLNFEVIELQDKISLMKKYQEMSKKFGTQCLYCGFRDADVLYHIRRVHYGMFPEGRISDETIYKELIKQMETLEKEEEEFPIHYLNANYKIKCQYCGEIFSTLAALMIHVKAVHETTCGPLPLREHQLKTGMRNCRFCNRILNNLDEYNWHAPRCICNPASKGYNEPQICEICGQTGTRDQIKAHRLRPHCNEDSTRFICEICGRALSSTTYYKYHLLRHQNKRRLRCRVEGCDKLFNSPAGLQKHHATHLPPEARKFVCTVCGKRFRNENFLLEHEHAHAVARNRCGLCGKFFKGKFGIQVHLSKFHRSGKRIAAPWRRRGQAMRSSEGIRGHSERKGGTKKSDLEEGGVGMGKQRESAISQEDYYEIVPFTSEHF